MERWDAVRKSDERFISEIYDMAKTQMKDIEKESGRKQDRTFPRKTAVFEHNKKGKRFVQVGTGLIAACFVGVILWPRASVKKTNESIVNEQSKTSRQIVERSAVDTKWLRGNVISVEHSNQNVILKVQGEETTSITLMDEDYDKLIQMLNLEGITTIQGRQIAVYLDQETKDSNQSISYLYVQLENGVYQNINKKQLE